MADEIANEENVQLQSEEEIIPTTTVEEGIRSPTETESTEPEVPTEPVPEPEPTPTEPVEPEPAPVEPEPDEGPVETEPDLPNEEQNDNTNYRRKKIMKYGLKEVADVIFFDVKSNRPVLVFDTLKVSNIENASESTQATGGKGNAPLIDWDYGRTATLTMQDALLSDQSLAMLAGTEIQDASANGTTVTRYEVVIAGELGAIDTTYEPAGEVVAYDNAQGVLGEEMVVDGATGALTVTGATAGDRIAVFYDSVAEAGATVVTFSSNKFPAIYRVVGTSLVRDQDGVDHAFQFVIPRAKLQAGFTFTMDPENVSTFDFNLNVLVNQADNKLYDIIRL